MKDTRLLQVFSKLSLKDLRELSKCVRSPFFNQREYVITLFDFLRENRIGVRNRTVDGNSQTRTSSAAEQHADGALGLRAARLRSKYIHEEKPENETKKIAFAKMFPEKEYDDHLMRNAMSLLSQLIEKYISIRGFLEDDAAVQLKLGAAYRQMNLEKHYLQTIRKVEIRQQGNNFRNADFYQKEYQLEAERYRWLSAQKRMAALNLQEISDNLDLSYITQKLRQTCFSISHQAVYPKDYDFGLLEKMLELPESGKYLDVPAVAVYYFCYRALTRTEEESFFRKFKSLLIEHAPIFPEREKRDLYLLATNYCIKKMNAGERQFAAEGLEIYKEALEQNALFADGRLSRFTFFNIITKALVCEEYDWTEDFILKYRSFLEPKHREASASFSLARVEYHRGNHSEALQFLQKADYEDLLQNLQAKALMAKIWFESEELDVLYSHLDAMEQFIRRRKVIGYHGELFRNFVFLLKKRIEIGEFEKSELLDFQEEVREVKAVAERRWLLEL